jgi:hypothetical protein
MLERRHGVGAEFPTVEEEEAGDDEMSGYDQWKEAFRLGEG